DKGYPREIQFKLSTKKLGSRIIYHETVTSTMDEGFKLGMEQAPEGTVIIAEGQTKGRGRLGRHWISAKGKGIYLSIILRPAMTPAEIPQLTLLAAVAVAEAIKNISGVCPAIKWPNDLQVGDKKLVGILTELNAETDRVRFVVVGIGVNVNATAAQLSPQATSLKAETHREFSRVELVKEILRKMEDWYEVFQAKGFKPIALRWKELAVTLGQHVRIVDPGRVIEGKAMDIDEDGGLLIRSDSGVIVKKMTGDVIPVR
ncbi:MAG: biotin--[acetyl-CoA-carboxylase] ligase, partial [Candidatus Omnitrophota bacterium]